MPGASEAVVFYYGLQSAYDAAVGLQTIDENAMYVITDTQRMYRGQTLVGANNVKRVEAVPQATEAIPNVIYVCESEGGTTLSTLNAAGTEMVTLINTAELQTWTDQVKLSEKVTVNLAGASIGGLADGAVLQSGETMTSIIKRLMIKEVNPSVTQPSLSLAVSPNASKECGETVTPTVTPTFNPGKYGFAPTATEVAVTSYTLTQQVNSEPATTLLDGVESTQAWTADSPITVPDGTLKFSGTVQHGDGVIPKTNTGTDVPSLQIKAGSKSATATITGYRNLFYAADTNSASGAPANSSAVRTLANKKANPTQNMQFDITVPAGSNRIVFAYPATLRDVSKVVIASMSMEATGVFTKSEVMVEGANGYNAVNYKVYTYTTTATGGMTADTYKVTI